MSYCPNCGQPADDGTRFCPACGTPLENAQPIAQQPDYLDGAATQKVSTKKEFLQLPENEKLRKSINTSGIICYICAGISLLVGLFMLKSSSVLIDAILLIGLGLGVHLAKSRVCAIILLVYAAINTIYSIVTTGKFSGYIILLAAIYAVINTFKLEKAWKEYNQS